MKKTNTHDLVLAALCAALTAVVAPFSKIGRAHV